MKGTSNFANPFDCFFYSWFTVLLRKQQTLDKWWRLHTWLTSTSLYQMISSNMLRGVLPSLWILNWNGPTLWVGGPVGGRRRMFIPCVFLNSSSALLFSSRSFHSGGIVGMLLRGWNSKTSGSGLAAASLSGYTTQSLSIKLGKNLELT